MRKLLAGLLILSMQLLYIQPVFAHVLITDETNTKGAVLHIIPDDDPVAGQQATLFFDTQNQLGESASRVSLIIGDKDGNETVVEVGTDGSLATASYTFPEQGVYELTFSVNSDDKTHLFKQSQRVSRGSATSALGRPTYAWAELLLLSSSLVFILLMIVAFNHRKDIARQGKW